MSSSKSKFKIVEVAWVDSEHESSWNSLTEILEANETGTLECRSAGFLISDKPDRIILATSVSLETEELENQVSAYITIPKQAILWMKDVRPVSPKKKKTIE